MILRKFIQLTIIAVLHMFKTLKFNVTIYMLNVDYFFFLVIQLLLPIYPNVNDGKVFIKTIIAVITLCHQFNGFLCPYR